jgi:hypothetical protein
MTRPSRSRHGFRVDLNLCCLIQSHYELGINATFWGKEDAEPKREAVEIDPIDALAWVCPAAK